MSACRETHTHQLAVVSGTEMLCQRDVSREARARQNEPTLKSSLVAALANLSQLE